MKFISKNKNFDFSFLKKKRRYFDQFINMFIRCNYQYIHIIICIQKSSIVIYLNIASRRQDSRHECSTNCILLICCQ